jgi:hypothetical protein
MPLRNRLT